jgi:hypothetical protein
MTPNPDPQPMTTYVADRAEANEDAASVWRRRAWNMKRRLDEIQGGSAEWDDPPKPRALRAENGDPDTIVPAPAPHKKHPGYPL